MKKLILFSFIFLSVSCIINPSSGSITLVDTALDNQFIVSLAIENNGTAWVGIIYDQYGLVKLNPDRSMEIFDHTNSCLVDSANVWDLEVDSQGNVWMLNADGLISYDGDNFTRYDSIDNNYYIPHAFDKLLAIDHEDVIWFIGSNPTVNCLTQKIYSFDGDEFTSHDPNGIDIGQCSSIEDIEVDKNGDVWFAFHRGNPVFLKYDGSEWTAFDSSDIGYTPYNISDIEFDSENNLWFNDDYTLSSIAYNEQPSIYKFNGTNKAIGFGGNHMTSELSIDGNDNIWFTGFIPRLGIFDMNQRWVINNSDNVGFCRVMKMAPSGDMWIGTSNGIMIYRYCQTK